MMPPLGKKKHLRKARASKPKKSPSAAASSSSKRKLPETDMGEYPKCSVRGKPVTGLVLTDMNSVLAVILFLGILIWPFCSSSSVRIELFSIHLQQTAQGNNALHTTTGFTSTCTKLFAAAVSCDRPVIVKKRPRRSADAPRVWKHRRGGVLADVVCSMRPSCSMGYRVRHFRRGIAKVAEFGFFRSSAEIFLQTQYGIFSVVQTFSLGQLSLLVLQSLRKFFDVFLRRSLLGYVTS